MTISVIQPLESYRLIQYATPIPCYICDSDNTFDSEYCSHCQAPMALAHQANSQKIAPKMIAVIGPSGVGKTVYLGMLMDMLSRLTGNMQVYARGAFSITLQQTVVGALSRGEFPHKTPNEPERWNWVHCQIRRKNEKQPLELIMPDMAGEAVIEEVDRPHTYRVVRKFLEKCESALVLIDAVRLRNGDRDQDFFAMKLLSSLSEMDADAKRGRSKRRVALLLTKADQCEECFENPSEFAKKHAAGLWLQCQERFSNYKFFACSVAGSCAACDAFAEGQIRVPLRIEPRGVTNPFEWLIGKN